MASNATMQMDHNDSKLVETKVVDIDNPRPSTRLHRSDKLWNEESKISSMHEDQCPQLPFSSVNSKEPIIEASSTNLQMQGFGCKGGNAGDLVVVQDTRYNVIDNHVRKKPSSASHLDMLSPSTDIGICNTGPLAGLIVMCNDRVRRSFFKHGILGVPLRKKPTLDRVDANTFIFLFEFEARALWGIYQAVSDVSIDIEKDAYRGSETAFPAQVKFRIVRKCRPLPEKFFKLAITENYYTPTKFQFELTDEQVTFLRRLYYVRDAEKQRLSNPTLSTEEGTPLYGKERFSEGSLFLADGVRTNGRNTFNILRNQTTHRPPQCMALQMRDGDNPDEKTSVSDKTLPFADNYDHPRYVLWHPEGLSNLKTNRDGAYVSKSQALEYGIDHGQNGCARVAATLFEPRATSLYCYPHVEEDIVSEDDLRFQLCKAKLFHNAGNPLYTPYEKDCIRSPRHFHDAAMDSNAKTEQLSDEEYYLRMLKSGQLNNSIHSKLLPSRSDPSDVSACQRLHRGKSASDVALQNLHLHPVKSLNPYTTMDIPSNVHSDLRAWQMREILRSAENAHSAMDTLTKRHLVSSGDVYTRTHDEGFSMRGNAHAQIYDYSAGGDSMRGKASACTRTPPEEEVWRDNLCRERSRNKLVQDPVVENAMNKANRCVSEQENVHAGDDERWLESIRCKIKDSTHKRQAVGDGGAWLGGNGHVSVSNGNNISKSCNGVSNLLKNEDHIQGQADQNGELESYSQHHNMSPCASVANHEVEGAKPPRKSVWSRLSASRSWLDGSQVPLPNEDMQSEFNNLVYSEALPLKRKVDASYAQPTEYEEEEVEEEEEEEKKSNSPDENCCGFVEDGVSVHFKRRKLDPSRASQEQGGNKPRERRKIRRPL